MENGTKDDTLDDFIFPPEALTKIDWDSRKSNFRNGVSPLNPGESLVFRPLCIGDFDKGFVNLLSQLTKVGDVSKEEFEKRFASMKACSGAFYVTVIEDIAKGEIIGAATLVVEQKFIHNCACRGRIEDVIVLDLYRGKQLGKLLVEALTLFGKSLGCYKMSLECKEENFKFYESFGYSPDGQHFMIQRFKE